MATPRFLAILLVTALLALSLSQGAVVVVEGRKVQVMRAVGHYGQGRWRSHLRGVRLQEQQEARNRMLSMVMDYSEPKANTNPYGSVPATPEDPPSLPWH